MMAVVYSSSVKNTPKNGCGNLLLQIITQLPGTIQHKLQSVRRGVVEGVSNGRGGLKMAETTYN